MIGELNNNHVKLAKLKGDFVWHAHENEDELFVVLKGVLHMDFRTHTTTTRAGEVLLVPKGVEHRPWTQPEEEVHLMLVEPQAIKHTGDVVTEKTVHTVDWI